MVKTYLRYEPERVFGVISSAAGNAVYDATGKLALAPALESVVVWDLKKGEQVALWKDSDNKAEVTCITRSPDNVHYAVGYNDGSIRIWSRQTDTTSITFNGHTGAVTALKFDDLGARLASGSKDTDLIVWDIIGETGLYRFRGHKDQITALSFLQKPMLASGDYDSTSPGYILSCSKDTLLKLWDLTTQQCVETHVGHRSECWAMDVSKDGSYFITGGGDAELKVWNLDREILAKGVIDATNDSKSVDETAKTQANTVDEIPKSITLRGPVTRLSRERVITIHIHPSGQFMGCQAADKSIELFRIRSQEEVRKKMARRKKRQREKAREKAAQQGDGGAAVEEEDEAIVVTPNDEMTPHQIVRTQMKIRSFDFAPNEDLSRASSIQVLASLTNNVLEVHSSALPSKSKSENLPEPERLHVLDLPGHRADVRALALSSDDELLCSASNNTLRIWNVHTGHCIRSLNCGYALTASFLPGNRHVILGTKTGDLELYDVQSASLVETLVGHDGAIWSLEVRPDKRGIVTGGADKTVKFWDFDMVEEKSAGKSAQRRLTLLHMRTLKMADDVLCVKYSPDQRFIAVALLDATVKVFFNDTLKFYLSLYGHKLPVLSMDISSDNALLVTASADKNVKLWGLDFGDCHKSLFAHQESVMAVSFVWGTHYFFSVSKDKFVKHWDGDKFECIQKLGGHHGEIWALAVGKHGGVVATGSHDRSIRIWKKTEEMLFLEEEKERELEELHDKEATREAETLRNIGQDGDEELAAAGKQTAETLKAGEKVVEALDVADADQIAWDEYLIAKKTNKNTIAPQKSPFLIAMGDVTPAQYVLKVMERIRSTDMEEAILVLPFSKVISLMEYLNIWAKKEWNLPLTCRVLFFMLKVHHNQLVANRVVKPKLVALRQHLRYGLQRQKDVVGYNIAAMRFIHRRVEDSNNADFFEQDDPNAAAAAAPITQDKEVVKRKFLSLT